MIALTWQRTHQLVWCLISRSLTTMPPLYMEWSTVWRPLNRPTRRAHHTFHIYSSLPLRVYATHIAGRVQWDQSMKVIANRSRDRITVNSQVVVICYYGNLCWVRTHLVGRLHHIYIYIYIYIWCLYIYGCKPLMSSIREKSRGILPLVCCRAATSLPTQRRSNAVPVVTMAMVIRMPLCIYTSHVVGQTLFAVLCAERSDTQLPWLTETSYLPTPYNQVVVSVVLNYLVLYWQGFIVNTVQCLVEQINQ